MKWLLEMYIPRWEDGESYKKIVIVDAPTLEAAVSVARGHLDSECSGPKEWGGASLERYIDLGIWKDTPFVDFAKVALKPRKPIRCVYCRSKVENKPDAEGFVCCPECGCKWNPEKKRKRDG
jgi:hypothetical protein